MTIALSDTRSEAKRAVRLEDGAFNVGFTTKRKDLYEYDTTRA